MKEKPVGVKRLETDTYSSRISRIEKSYHKGIAQSSQDGNDRALASSCGRKQGLGNEKAMAVGSRISTDDRVMRGLFPPFMRPG
jgi:hypothetical protein